MQQVFTVVAKMTDGGRLNTVLVRVESLLDGLIDRLLRLIDRLRRRDTRWPSESRPQRTPAQWHH